MDREFISNKENLDLEFLVFQKNLPNAGNMRFGERLSLKLFIFQLLSTLTRSRIRSQKATFVDFKEPGRLGTLSDTVLSGEETKTRRC